MAEELKCKCGAGPFASVKDLRIHILTSARAEGKGIHGWPTKESPAPYPPPPPPYIGAKPTVEGLPEPPPQDGDAIPSDLTFELDEMRYMFRVLRSEFDALKVQVGAASVAWADAVPPPRPIDQEAVNLVQLDAMLGIDQPGPLDIKEAALVAAVAERIEAPMAQSEIVTEKARGVPRGVFLILAFVAVVGVVVLVITQT